MTCCASSGSAVAAGSAAMSMLDFWQPVPDVLPRASSFPNPPAREGVDQARPFHKVFWRTPAEHLLVVTGRPAAKRCSPGVLGNTWSINVRFFAMLIGWTAKGQALTVQTSSTVQGDAHARHHPSDRRRTQEREMGRRYRRRDRVPGVSSLRAACHEPRAVGSVFGADGRRSWSTSTG